MKNAIHRIYTLILLMGIFVLIPKTQAQSTKGINYQSVVRDNAGALMPNQAANLRFQIIKGTPAGSIVYDEDQTTMTNDYSLFSVVIGKGTPSVGNFASITWGDDDYFLKVFFNGTDMGTSPLEGVPYSKVATQMRLDQLIDASSIPPSNGQVLKWDGLEWAPGNDNSGSSLWQASGSELYYDAGNVGIGNNNPDEELVVGTPIGSGWIIPTITVGGQRTGSTISGGAVAAGTSTYRIAMSTSSNFGRARIISTANGPLGEGAIEVRCKNFGIGAVGNPATDLHILQTNASSRAVRIEDDGSGNHWELGVGVSSDNYKFSYNGLFKAEINNSSGAYVTLSDRRLKKNLENLPNVLANVLQLNPQLYHYNDNLPGTSKSIGFIAQEVESLFPETVINTEDGMKGVMYDNFSVIAIKAIQEQQEVIQTLEEKIIALEKLVNSLK